MADSGTTATATEATTAEPSAETDDPTTGTPTPATTTTGMETTDDGPADSSSEDDGSTSAGAGDPGDWLLTVDNGSSPPRLMRIGLAGDTTPVCELAPSVNYDSIVFLRDGTLIGHNAAENRIDEINPCNCSFQIIGPTSLGPIALGLGPATQEGLLVGIDPALDSVVRVDVDTGLATTVGYVGFMYGTASVAWSDAAMLPYAVEGDNDFLYTVDITNGMTAPVEPLTEDVTNPGLAVHPNDDGLYLCSGSTFYTLDTAWLLLPVATLGLSGACRTLAAPQTALDCIDSL